MKKGGGGRGTFPFGVRGKGGGSLCPMLTEEGLARENEGKGKEKRSRKGDWRNLSGQGWVGGRSHSCFMGKVKP